MTRVGYVVQWRPAGAAIWSPWGSDEWTEQAAVETVCAELRQRFPFHDFRILTRTVIYCDWIPL